MAVLTHTSESQVLKPFLQVLKPYTPRHTCGPVIHCHLLRRHGSGFPLPSWRSPPTDHLPKGLAAGGDKGAASGKAAAAAAKAGAAAAAAAAATTVAQEDPRCAEYRSHPWNINCLTRSKGSVLRYVQCKELVTGACAC